MAERLPLQSPPGTISSPNFAAMVKLAFLRNTLRTLRPPDTTLAL
jgi:hypothetical protein